MKIGLDWDGTVSEDTDAFLNVVKAFLDSGHEVAIVTWRVPPQQDATGWSRDDVWNDVEETFAKWGFRLPIIYCSGQAKRDCYPADIWIDDNPASVLFTLQRKPRFVENAKDYDKDEMLCENEHGRIETTWAVLNPAYSKLKLLERAFENEDVNSNSKGPAAA